MTKRRFEFPLRTVKAFENSDGVKHIVAVASDDKLDLYREYFDVSALADMAKSCQSVKSNKPTEGLVDLMETHYETFGFGYADDGWINRDKTEDDTNIYELHVDFALKGGYACGKELYDEIKNNQIVKQLSVGGYIENWDENTERETVIFEDEEGNEIEIPVLKIKHFVLEHVAVTPEGWAVNPRTRFETAKSKELGFAASIYKSLADEGTQKMIQERIDTMKKGTKPDSQMDNKTPEKSKGVTIADLPDIIMTKMVNFFTERDGKMTDIEKAKKLTEEYQEKLKGLELTEEETKEINLSFAPVGSEEGEDEDTDETPDMGEEIEKALAPVMETIKGLQEKLDEKNDEEAIKNLEKDFSDKLEVVEKSLKEKDEVIEELKGKIEAFGEQTQTSTDEPEDNTDVDKDLTDPPAEDIRTVETMWER